MTPGAEEASPLQRVLASVRRAGASLQDRFGDRPIVDVALGVFRRDREINGTVVGSAVAFRLFLFFVPLLLVVVGVAGFLSSVIDPDDVNDQAAIGGRLAEQIDTALSQPTQTRWLATAGGLVGVATAGYSLSKVLVAASTLAWRLPERPKASPRIVGVLAGLIAGIGIIAAITNRIRTELGIGVASFSFVAAFLIYLVAWIVVSMMLPRGTTDVAAMLPGAVLVSLTLTTMQAISQLYLPGRLSRASALYGTFGATVVTLGWFFFLGRAIVVGFAVNAVINERFGTIARFVFSWPLVRILPRRSSLIRRVFGLDDIEVVTPPSLDGPPPTRPD
jgi:uncharacterized BrkB/YihY/UPF0761 family membrane protein